MSNVTALRGECPAPFFDEASFGTTGGYVPGRYCATSDLIEQGLRCCLPCPATDLTYPDDFYSLSRMAGPINLVGFGLCFFMLLSFAVLPTDKTRRHYLNIFLIVCIMLLELGFIVPWANQPEQCYDQITPNDMNTNLTCAWAGALVIFGAISVMAWALVRSSSMHILICWDVHPGKTFFWASNVFAWGVSILVAALELVYTGVSFRFGDYCHVNHNNSLQSFWVWLLLLSSIALFLQVATFAYCIYVYMRSTAHPTHAHHTSTSTTSATHSQTFFTIYRLRKVLALQWRGLAIALLVCGNAIYFAISFLMLDNQTVSHFNDPHRTFPWVFCMVETQNKNKCLSLARDIVVDEGRLIAVLVVLSVIGIEAFLLICRWEMITGWLEVFGVRKKKNGTDWISVHAKSPIASHAHRPQTTTAGDGGYEMRRISTSQNVQGIDDKFDDFGESPGSRPVTRDADGDLYDDAPHSYNSTAKLQAPEPVFRSPNQESRGSMEPFFGRRDDSGPDGEHWRPLTGGSGQEDGRIKQPLRTFWAPGARE